MMMPKVVILAVLTAVFIHQAKCATCNSPIGVADSNKIDSSNIIVSSEEPGYEKDKVRWGCCQNEIGAAWCPKKDDLHPFLEIRLDKPTIVGKMVFEPPTRGADNSLTHFMKSFGLKIKVPDFVQLINVAQDIPAISNASIKMATINLLPPQIVQKIRIEPKTSQSLPCFKLELYACDVKSLCPTNFCQNGGVCSGVTTCDCTATKGFYGSQCQYTVDKIPKTVTHFVRISSHTVITTTFQLTFEGSVTVVKDSGVTSVVIPPASTVDMPISATDPCLKDLDHCTTGFSISLVFRFSHLDSNPKFVISNRGTNPNNAKGVHLFFQANNVTCLVRTSTQLWMLKTTFTLVESKWYEMTVTWSPGRGLQLLEEGKVVGSAIMPGAVQTPVTTGKVQLGFKSRTTRAVLIVRRVIVVALFWTEAERAGIHTVQDSSPPTTIANTPDPVPAATTTPAALPDCKSALGMKDGSIRNDQITVSSSQLGHGKEKLRAGCCEHEKDGAWCADPSDTEPWVQVDFDRPTALSVVSFFLPGRTSDSVIPSNYIKTVRMEYFDPFDNQTSMEVYNDNIPATYNATLSYSITLQPKIVTTSVRMYITKSEGDACFRFEYSGCDPKDLCPANWCHNNGVCDGEMKCSCPKGYFGDRCQLTKTDITPTETTFQEIVNKTLVTSTGQNLTVDGKVTVIKVNRTINVVQVTQGGTVTFPEDNCLKDLTSCTTGFTLTLVIKVVTFTDDQVTIVTSGGENKDSTGLVLVYNRVHHVLTFTVKDHAHSWTVKVTPFTWVEQRWYQLTLTWSPTSGSKVIVGGTIVGSKTGSDPSPPATTTNALCIGCTYVDKTTITSTTTTTIWVKSVTKVHIYVTDLVRADLVAPPHQKPPQPKECTDSKKDLLFKNTTGTEVVTSLGNVKAHGDVSIGKENSDVILVLDEPGEYIEVSKTGFPCIDDITTCQTNLTYRITFRFNQIHTEPNFILSSGGDIADSTGISLYYFHGSLNFWVKDGHMVWMAIYNHNLTVNTWYTMDASWSHVDGIQLRIDGSALKARIRQGHSASPVNTKHPLHIARSPAPQKNVTSTMDVLVFRVWTKTVEELTDLGCTDDLTIINPPARPTPTTPAPTTPAPTTPAPTTPAPTTPAPTTLAPTTPAPTTPAPTTPAPTTPAPTTEAPLTETKVNFKEITGGKVITTYTNFTIVGVVTLEKVTVGKVLVIGTPGSYVDIGKTGVPCIDDVSSCHSGFNFRFVFSLIRITTSPQVLISSGADTTQGKGLTVRYFNKELIIYIKTDSHTVIGTFPHHLVSTYWYTLDVSWSVRGSLKVHINNVDIVGTTRVLPHPSVTVTYTLLIGKSPQSNETTLLKVYEIDLWTRIYTRITRQRLELPVIRALTTTNPNAPPLPAPGNCVIDDLDSSTKMTYDLTFLNIVNGVVATPEVVFEVTGNPSLSPHNDHTMTLYGGDDSVEVTCVPCLSNLLKCDAGFTILLKLVLPEYCPIVHIFDAIQNDRKDMGLRMTYQDGNFHTLLQAAYKKWILSVPYTLRAGGTYHIQISWRPNDHLVLYVNGVSLGNATALSLPFFFYGGSRPMRVGNNWREVSTCKTMISQVFAVMEYRDVFPIIRSTTGAPTTTPATTPPAKTGLATTAPDDGLIPEFTWKLVGVTKSIIVSRELTLVIGGGPKVDMEGVALTQPGHNMKIPNLQTSCITNPDRCTKGFTIEILIKLTTLEEGSVIFTSGGERPNAPGITMIYRYGYIHVIASTPTRAWYLTVSRRVIYTKTFCKIYVSWSQTTTLKLYIDQILVGVAEPAVPHVNTTTQIKTDLTIGGGPVTCVIKEVRIWFVHIDILITTGTVSVKGTTTAAPTTAAPTTAAPTTAAPTTAAPTTAAPTTAAPTTAAPKTAAPTTAVPTTAAPTTAVPKTAAPTTVAPKTAAPTTSVPGQCPIGCRRADECYTPPPSTKATTAAPTTRPPPPPPTTPTTTTTTTTTPTTTTTTPTTTTTTPTTTTTTPTTTTTTTTPTTTEIGCPNLASSLMLVAGTDNRGQALMTCILSATPDPNIEVMFTWAVLQHKTQWTATIRSPDKAAPLMVSKMDVRIENRKVVCAAKARYAVTGAKWCSNTIRSNIVHPEIKVTTTNTITVVEGRGNQTIDVTTTVPPSSYCEPQDQGRCVVLITTIIDRERAGIRCSRNEMVPQAVLGVSKVSDGSSPTCGILLTKDNWSKVITIPVKATIDRVRDRNWIRKLKIRITVVGEITRIRRVRVIGTVTLSIINRDRRATCSSVNDPHMTTFDGVRYNNFIPGEFVLYKHTTMEYEVRALYQTCNRGRATCNLGAAVRSGDDVITFTTDPRAWARNSVIVVQLYLNGELTSGTKIYRYGCGQKYEVILPHGTVITIIAQRKPFINVYVKATSTDFERTEGLCGNFNGNGRDDLAGASGRNPDRFSRTWIRTTTIFRGVLAIKIPAPPTFCSCLSGQTAICQPGLDVYHCQTVRTQSTDITVLIIRAAKRPSVRGRFRRAVTDESNGAVQNANQLDQDETEIWTNENATTYCTDYLEENEKVKKCQNFLDANQTSESIINCAEDLVALGDRYWASSHLDHIIEECMTEVQQNPETWANTTGDEPPQPPKDIVDGLCRKDCGEHGECAQGVCKCVDGWTGEECEIGKQTLPEVMKADEPCDLLETSDDCRSVRVDGDKFVESEDLTCNFKYVNVGDHVTPSGDKDQTVPAQFVSMNHVICPVPAPRHYSQKASRSAIITVSNDGKSQSVQPYLHVVYKSSCQDCQIAQDGKQASCVHLEDSCLIDGQCYGKMESYSADDCYRCDPAIHKNYWTKISEPRCMPTSRPNQNNVKPATVDNGVTTASPGGDKTPASVDNGVKSSSVNNDDEEEKHTIIIVLGAVCGVLALVIGGISVVVFKIQSKGKKDQLLDSPPRDKAFDFSRSNVTQPSKVGDVSDMPDAHRLNTYINPTFQ